MELALSAWQLEVTPAECCNTCPSAREPAKPLSPWHGDPKMISLLFSWDRQGGEVDSWKQAEQGATD